MSWIKAWLAVLMFMVVAGCCRSSPGVSLEIRRAEDESAPGLSEMVMSGWGYRDTFYLHDEVLLSEADVDSARVVPWRAGPAVEIVLTAAGSERFAEVTGLHIGHRLAMVVDGELVCAPVVRDTISGGKALITGDFSEEEALRISHGLSRR